jgi:hypothetical protein
VRRVRSIGFQPLRQRGLIGELSAFLGLGAILRVKEARTRGDVVATADADAVARAMDRKTFTVADIISQAGGSALQALSTVPGPVVKRENLPTIRPQYKGSPTFNPRGTTPH